MSDPFGQPKPLTLPEELPLLPVRDVVIFPYMILPLFVGRDASIKAIEESWKSHKLIQLCTQKNVSDENPIPQDIYPIGTYASMIRMRKLPDGRVKIMVQAIGRARVKKYTHTTPFYTVAIEQLEDFSLKAQAPADVQIEALIRTVKEQLEKLISLGKMLSPDLLMLLDESQDAGQLADLIGANLGLRVPEAQSILELVDVEQRLEKVSSILTRELDVLNMQAKIRSQARDEMTRSQREYYLREQLKAIKTELGELDAKEDDIDELRHRIETAGMLPAVQQEALKQLHRLERMHPESSESSVVRGYLDWLIDMPWAKKTDDNIDIKKAKEILDEDHFGLDKVKERILEYLAVRKIKDHTAGPILCFSGPPGVGKTSLGKSIARAMGKKFHRVSLGGLRDEAEIRGHRRTYVGAMPGKIIQGIKLAGTNNPVFMLDEIDKLGSDFRGDPSSALLEVLDPEQNSSFVDHYLNVPFDLSKVLFITTANLTDPIPPALKDRMEIIQLPGYTELEKNKIAEHFLIPKQLENNGLTVAQLKFTEGAICKIIHHYTQEAGLRNLEREISSICRKVARKITEGHKDQIEISDKNIQEYLGIPKYLKEEGQEKNEIGIATGLAWTAYGGEVLYVEAREMKGKTKALTLTGQLGDVMKESAQASLGYIRSCQEFYGIAKDYFDEHELHIHVPKGAIPKDGPSAGVTLATAILSIITKRAVKKDIAMTGEISLSGKVYAVGGIRDKVLAAMRQNIFQVIIPEQNKDVLKELPEEVIQKVKFIFVKTLEDVFRIALETTHALKTHKAREIEKAA